MEKQQHGGIVRGSVQPYQTYYSMNLDTFGTVLGTENRNILVSRDSRYWIASRSIELRENYCEFGVFFINSVILTSPAYSSSNGNGGGSDYGNIFPMVSLDCELISLNGTNYEVQL